LKTLRHQLLSLIAARLLVLKNLPHTTRALFLSTGAGTIWLRNLSPSLFRAVLISTFVLSQQSNRWNLDHTTEFSPYHFWSQRARVSITDFDQPLRIFFDLLVKLCLYHLFQDEEGFYLVDDIDLVSTSLVMILYNETGWYCKIAEPIII
jgi:hypothetical protein